MDDSHLCITPQSFWAARDFEQKYTQTQKPHHGVYDRSCAKIRFVRPFEICAFTRAISGNTNRFVLLNVLIVLLLSSTVTWGAAPIIELTKKAGTLCSLSPLLPHLLSFTFFGPIVGDMETKEPLLQRNQSFSIPHYGG
jgi:hypothetical protein